MPYALMPYALRPAMPYALCPTPCYATPKSMAQMTAAMASRSGGNARWISSLRLRLALAIAISVALAGIGASGLALRMARRALTNDVRGIAGQAAGRAADQVSRLSTPLAVDAIERTLRQLNSEISEIGHLSYIQDSAGGPVVSGTTGMSQGEVGLGLAVLSIKENRTVFSETIDTIRVASPVLRNGQIVGAVLVRADLGAVIRLQQRALEAIIGFALLSIIALVVLVDLLAFPLVYKPIQQLRETIARVTAGDFSARAPVWRHDELGEMAVGLNEMLARLEHFNDELQARVDEATVELQQRNEQLVESYHRLFGLREQLASAEQLASVGQTAANVAHQVGTPLNLISGYVQMLKEDLGADSPHAARLAIIEEQIGKVTTTVRSLLDRSRQMGRRSRVAAGGLVGRVAEVMRPNLEAANIRLEVEAPGADTPILVDATNLELALLNLMTNAVDAMPKGGTLSVVVRETPQNKVRVEVSDTGHGISDELMTRIFDPWVSTKKPGRGTGLGLAIARDVIAAHGGTITVASTVGQGTTFTIDLPSDSARDAGRAAS
jgi:two-component system, NtrC family, sensor kinase